MSRLLLNTPKQKYKWWKRKKAFGEWEVGEKDGQKSIWEVKGARKGASNSIWGVESAPELTSKSIWGVRRSFSPTSHPPNAFPLVAKLFARAL